VYFVRYNLASVSSRALARNLAAPSVSAGGAFTQGTSSAPLGGAGAASGFTGSTASAPAASLAPASPDTNASNTGFLGLDFDLRWLYLAFTLAGFGMCIAPKLVLPARLPGLSKA
jgi:hypothetical protein